MAGRFSWLAIVLVLLFGAAPLRASVNLTGGVWQLQVFFGGRATGIITGGTLENNGDNTFHVVAHMLSAATGALTFDGTLSHTAFPPTLIGRIQ